MQIDAATIRECRERDGDAADDRPPEVDDRLAPEEELGYGEGLPLVDNDYDAYPSEPSELALPEWSEFIRELASHGLVNGYDDMVSELTSSSHRPTLRDWLDAVERACDLFDVDPSEAFDTDTDAERDDSDGDDDALDLITTTVPADLANDAETNPLVVAHLYALGLSVAEISELLADELGRETAVNTRQVRDTLKRAGLLGGRTRDERERERKRRGPGADEVNRNSVTTTEVKRDDRTGRNPLTTVELE